MDVLLFIDEDRATDLRVGVTLELVRVCGGHINCIQVMSPNALVASGSFGTAKMLADRAEDVERHKEMLRDATRQKMTAAGASWEYHSFDGDIVQSVIEQSRLVDVIVFSAERQPSALNRMIPSADELLPRVRVPVLAVPSRDPMFSIARPVIIAWDGSPQCAYAVRSALEPLRCASSILIVTVEGERPEITAAQAKAYLAHHKLQSDILTVPATIHPVSTVLIETVHAHRAACVVMGAYGHGRAREFLLGGVTREMLRNCPVPLLLAH
ncbi:universal stress protein [Pedomonas mirosovicensis]|uniref:universal stress protein n=1 Tax=Pedomonas mirosovicensis TaxID=2908641 RepID=UPI00216A85A3|nr:universal stress protein [Pedomonas mirosovicensis]MCH8686662.1 universal stress protein [Pedomonas mirosovicensis]